MRRPAALPPLFVAAALAAAAPTAAQEVWTGAAGTKSWNDGGNWESGRAPVPTIGLFALFDDPAGAAFGFGGSSPLHFGRIELSTNSGPVTLKAPGFVLGGSVNSEPEVGFIAEAVARDSVLRNFSTNALTLRGGATAGWNLVVDATNGPIRIEGGLDPAGHSVAKRGPHPLEIVGGEPASFPAFDLADGGLSLSGRADVAIPNLELGAARFAGRIGAPEVRVEGGSTLRLSGSVRPNTNDKNVWFRYPLVLGSPGGKPDASTLVGNQGRITFNRAPSFAPGCCITNTGIIAFGFHPTSDIPRTVRMPAGMRVHAYGLWLGGMPNLAWNNYDRTFHNGIKLLVEGPEIPDTPGPKKLSGPPTLLELGGYGLLVGGSFDAAGSSNALARVTGAAVVRTSGWIMVPEPPRRAWGNRLFLEGGARAEAVGVQVGTGSMTNVLSLSGEGTSLMVGKEGVLLGYGSDQPGESVGNRIVLKDRARLHSEGPLRIGRGRRHNDRTGSLSKDNTLSVSGGARLATGAAEIGSAGFTGPVLSPAVVVEGTGSRWDLSAQPLTVGAARGAALSNAVLSIRNGAAVTNAHEVIVGLASGSTARDCRLRLAAARLFTSGNVRVGRTVDGGNGDFESVGNSAVLSGANGVGALWDFGGGGLLVGYSEGWRRTLRGNFVELRPGARVQNIGKLVLGCGSHREGAFSEGNELRLLGGSIAPVKTLRWGKGGVLALGVNPASKLGTTPIEVEGDVEIEKGALVKPLPGKGLRPRLFPVLRWKGNAKGLENLALAPGVDGAKWKLHVDAGKKQVLLQLLP